MGKAKTCASPDYHLRKLKPRAQRQADKGHLVGHNGSSAARGGLIIPIAESRQKTYRDLPNRGTSGNFLLRGNRCLLHGDSR